MDLLQNCDLPPPLKLISPFDKHDKLTSNFPKIINPWEAELEPSNQNDQNPSLLRALQLSQSRAREAERKAAAANACNEQMGFLLLEESLRLSAHRRWVSLLEMEILLLHKKSISNSKCNKRDGLKEEDEDIVPALSWCMTLALCLGIGVALGQYMF